MKAIAFALSGVAADRSGWAMRRGSVFIVRRAKTMWPTIRLPFRCTVTCARRAIFLLLLCVCVYVTYCTQHLTIIVQITIGRCAGTQRINAADHPYCKRERVCGTVHDHRALDGDEDDGADDADGATRSHVRISHITYKRHNTMMLGANILYGFDVTLKIVAHMCMCV